MRKRSLRARAAVAGALAVSLAGSLSLFSAAGVAPKAHADDVVFYEGFNSDHLDGDWTTYSGHPGGNWDTTWKSSNVSVSDGHLNLTARRSSDGDWTAGGVGAFGHAFKYGTVTARVRMDSGQGVTGVALLWPTTGFPPELDYFEEFGSDPDRTSYMTTIHRSWDNAMIHHKTWGDFTDWHTVSVEWEPDMVRYSVDGRTISTTWSSSYSPNVSMWPGFQVATGTGDGDRPDWSTPSSVRMQVDWISITK